MRSLLICLSLTLVLYLAVSAEDTDVEETLVERQKFIRTNHFPTKKLRKNRGRKGEVEMETKVLVKRVDNLEKRLDENQGEVESDVEKREQGWSNKGVVKLKSGKIVNLYNGEEKVVELEKRQLNQFNRGFSKFGRGKKQRGGG